MMALTLDCWRPDTISEMLRNIGLDAKPCFGELSAWEAVWREMPYQPVMYARSMLDYQHEYLRGAGWDVQDVSLVFFNNDRPCGIWPLALAIKPSGEPVLTSTGGAVMAPLFDAGLSPRSVKRLCGKSVDFLRALGKEIGVKRIEVEQGVEPERVKDGATEWHRQLMAAGALPSVRHDLFVDLCREDTQIRRSFRKSYKPLINVGLRHWRHSILDHECISDFDWNEFRVLHREVAGRNTRSDRTWAKQLDMVRAGEAFLVCLRDTGSGRLVGAGLFQHTRDEGLYAVGAYDRSLFDKPLGHVVQQKAIERLKADGRKWYRIGERFYPQDASRPSEKEVSISVFKEGFASHTFCRYAFHLHLTEPRAGRGGR